MCLVCVPSSKLLPCLTSLRTVVQVSRENRSFCCGRVEKRALLGYEYGAPFFHWISSMRRKGGGTKWKKKSPCVQHIIIRIGFVAARKHSSMLVVGTLFFVTYGMEKANDHSQIRCSPLQNGLKKTYGSKLTIPLWGTHTGNFLRRGKWSL